MNTAPVYYNGGMRLQFGARLSRRHSFKMAFSAFSARFLRGEGKPAATPDTLRNIPERSPRALTGSQFAESVSSLDREQREQAILSELLSGNLPGFLRKLAPVQVTSGLAQSATIFVLPEYLAVGSDSDFLRIPTNLYTATAVALKFGFLLPTRKMVDAIYNESARRFSPQPLPAGPEMTSTAYYRKHNQMIEQQSQARGLPSGVLSAGHKKDVVLTNRLRLNPGHIAIYGWHRAPGDPIQPLTTVHGANYADYSHGIRLVARTALIDGQPRTLSEILQDRVLANLLSDEGPIRVPGIIGA